MKKPKQSKKQKMDNFWFGALFLCFPCLFFVLRFERAKTKEIKFFVNQKNKKTLALVFFEF